MFHGIHLLVAPNWRGFFNISDLRIQVPRIKWADNVLFDKPPIDITTLQIFHCQLILSAVVEFIAEIYFIRLILALLTKKWRSLLKSLKTCINEHVPKLKEKN